MSFQPGNFISKLQGLKNVGGRRVMPGDEMTQNLDYEAPDATGTAPQQPLPQDMAPPTQNVPQSDLGGQVSAQSNDVRANVVEGENQPGVMSRIGQYLKSKLPQQNPNQPLAAGIFGSGYNPLEPQAPQPEQMPEQPAQPQETQLSPAQGGIGLLGEGLHALLKKGGLGLEDAGKAIADYVSPTKRSEQAERNTELLNKAQGNLPADIEKANAEPYKYAAYGSALEVANSPALSAEFKKITGIDYGPEIAEKVSKHEEAMKAIEDSYQGLNDQLDEDAAAIRQRIETNSTTDDDKYYIGLALMMPLLVGGFFGQEAGFEALAGSAKGIGEVLKGRDKNLREDEGSLREISKLKTMNQDRLGKIASEKAQLEPEIRKNLPKDENAHLIGQEGIEYKDPKTGKNVKATQISPGFVAKNEYLTSADDKKRMQKAADELTDVKTYVDDVNDITENILGVVSQLKDKGIFQDAFTKSVNGVFPQLLTKVTQDVDINGRKVNAGSYLQEQLGFLANAYGQAKQIGQLDRAAQAHVEKLFNNPTTKFISPDDAIEQMIAVRDLSQRGLVNQAKNKGFLPEFLIKGLEEKNEPVFGKLNKKEDEKEAESVFAKAVGREPKYAK